MQRVEIDAYTFDELDDRAKARVRSWYAGGLDYEWWDFTIDEMIEDLSPFGLDINQKDVSFSGFWNQGDGACFSVSVGTSDLVKYLKGTKQTKKYWQLYLNILRGNIDISFNIKGNDRWGYSMTIPCDQIDFTLYVDYVSDEAYNRLYDAARNLSQDVLEFCQDKANDLYYQLQQEYEYLLSDESIADSCAANEWLFTEDGRFIW